LDVIDVEDILIDILDTQFHTECEDDSPYEVAAELCRIFEICKSGDATQLSLEAQKLQQAGCKLWLSSKPAPDTQSDEQESITGEERVETPPPQLMETDPDGWTVVTSRKK
jgi:hypothetical protein